MSLISVPCPQRNHDNFLVNPVARNLDSKISFFAILPGQKRLSASSSRAFASILKVKMVSGDFSYLIQLQRSFCCFLEIFSLRRSLEKVRHNHNKQTIEYFCLGSMGWNFNTSNICFKSIELPPAVISP